MWNLNERDQSNHIETTLLGTLDSQNEDLWSAVHGISNHATDPLITGVAGVSGECECAPQQSAGISGVQELQRRAFLLRLSDAPLDSTEVLDFMGNNSGGRNVIEDDETVTGRFHCSGDNCTPDSDICDTQDEGAVWVDGVDMLLDDFVSGGRAIGRGINSIGQIVGGAFEDGIGPPCEDQALFFEDATTDKCNLGDRLPPEYDSQSHALSINVPTAGPTQVVGFSPDASYPILWQREGCEEPCSCEEEWVGYDLSTMFHGSDGPLWTLLSAHSVNNNGNIVTWGYKDGFPEASYVVLLTEIFTPNCPADISNTGTQHQVNVFDLFILLSQWGDCVDGEFCEADLSSSTGFPDGKIDVFDLFFLLENWDLCSASYDAELDEDYCYEKYPGGGQDLEDCLEAVAIANGYIEE